MADPVIDIDWNEVWKAQMKRNRGSGSGRDCARIWESKESAEKFWNMSKENKNRVEKTIAGTDINLESRILDIGAGPGTLAIPFAQKVAHVTAVEPAEGMVTVLREKMAEQGVENISLVQKRWEDVDVKADLNPPYDAVIASFSLGMFDIREAIEKMMDASSNYVYLYHFAGETHWDRQYRVLWLKLHGKKYYSGPKSDVLYNVLYQLGIYPNVKTFRLQHKQRFSSLEEAMDALRPQFQITTEDQDSMLREHLSLILKEENGSLIFPASSIRVKMWWKK
jgi:cyclopropane fatty-acyl-phospholipid synthase-like methyltransferase